MSIARVQVTFDCDGCSRQFHVEIDPAHKLPMCWPIWSVADLAEDYCRGGLFTGYADEKRSGKAEPGFMCSVQGGMQLCPGCTHKVDDLCSSDEPTAEDVKRALET